MKQQCPDCAGGGIFGVGNGKCSNCYGGGKVGTIADDVAGGKRPCPKCRGTGQCQTCGGSGLVYGSAAPSPKRPHADDELNPFDDKVAIRVHCPKCGDLDWFEWRFLGRLTDPVCGHSWYAGSGTYAFMQIWISFRFGSRFARYVFSAKPPTSRSVGEVAVGWLAKGMFWTAGALIGVAWRLEFGLLMIPIQAVAGLMRGQDSKSEVLTRVVVGGAVLAALAGGMYELRKNNANIRRSSNGGMSSGVAYPAAQPPIEVQRRASPVASASQVAAEERDNVRAATAHLIGAIERHDMAAAESAFLEGGDPNMTCVEAQSVGPACGGTETPLHLSVVPDRLVGPPEPGHFPTGTDMIRMLLEHGADPNRRGDFIGFGPATALRHVVIWSGTNYGVGYPSPAIVSLMLAHGADPTLDNPIQDAIACANKDGQYPEDVKTCSELIELLTPPSR